VNYPSDKKLIANAFAKVIKEVSKFNEQLAKEQAEEFEATIQKEYEKNDKVSAKRHFEIAQVRLEYLYLRTYEELQKNRKYQEAFGLCHELVDQYINNKKDKIVSTVDPDARIAHKSPGNIKRGYKDHIIVDEDSEIILASVQTAFNVGDEKKLQELVEKVEEELGIKPEEISADKVYGTLDNRAYLKANEITSNIQFYKESSREIHLYALKDFQVSKDLNRVTCPNGKTTEDFRITHDKASDKDFKKFKFNEKECTECPMKDQCLYRDKNGKLQTRGRRVDVPVGYEVVLADRERVGTLEFEEACNKRFIVERRFATMVRKRGLRRCRYLGMKRVKMHIIMANMVCNIVRMVNLIFQPSLAMT
jgi:IS5 family transposase